MATFIIRIEDARFYRRIGVMEQERQVGNEFSVDVAVTYSADIYRPEELNSTVSYADIYEMVKETVAAPSLLLESVAVKIADAIQGKWGNVNKVSVKITKLAPPIPGIQGTCSVEYEA